MGAASSCCTTTPRPCARAASRQRSTAGGARPASSTLVPSAAPGEQAEDRHPHGGRVRAIGQQPVVLDEQRVRGTARRFHAGAAYVPAGCDGAVRGRARTRRARPRVADPCARHERSPVRRQVAQPAADPAPGLEERRIAARLQRAPRRAEPVQVAQRLEPRLNVACRVRATGARNWARHGAMIGDDEPHAARGRLAHAVSDLFGVGGAARRLRCVVRPGGRRGLLPRPGLVRGARRHHARARGAARRRRRGDRRPSGRLPGRPPPRA